MLNSQKSNNLHYNCNISSQVPVSIIIPVYNKGRYLPRSIGSLQNQTFTNFEIVVVDDCSTDFSSECIITNMQTDFRIKFIQHTYNQGIGNSRNHAVLSSSGFYIMSLDPDDAYVNNSVEVAYQSALQHRADVLEFRMAAIHRTYANFNWMNCRKSYHDNEVVLTKLQKFVYGNPDIHTCKKIIKRSVYVKAVRLILPFIKNKRICISEDLLHFGSILFFARNYICTQFLVYLYYRDLPDSSISKGYVSNYRKKITHNYVKQIIRYFYRYRKSLWKCDVNEFLNETGNADLFRRLVNVNRTPNKNLSFLHSYFGFHVDDFKDEGYLFIYK